MSMLKAPPVGLPPNSNPVGPILHALGSAKLPAHLPDEMQPLEIAEILEQLRELDCPESMCGAYLLPRSRDGAAIVGWVRYKDGEFLFQSEDASSDKWRRVTAKEIAFIGEPRTFESPSKSKQESNGEEGSESKYDERRAPPVKWNPFAVSSRHCGEDLYLPSDRQIELDVIRSPSFTWARITMDDGRVLSGTLLINIAHQIGTIYLQAEERVVRFQLSRVSKLELPPAAVSDAIAEANVAKVIIDVRFNELHKKARSEVTLAAPANAEYLHGVISDGSVSIASGSLASQREFTVENATWAILFSGHHGAPLRSFQIYLPTKTSLAAINVPFRALRDAFSTALDPVAVLREGGYGIEVSGLHVADRRLREMCALARSHGYPIRVAFERGGYLTHQPWAQRTDNPVQVKLAISDGDNHFTAKSGPQNGHSIFRSATWVVGIGKHPHTPGGCGIHLHAVAHAPLSDLTLKRVESLIADYKRLTELR